MRDSTATMPSAKRRRSIGGFVEVADEEVPLAAAVALLDDSAADFGRRRRVGVADCDGELLGGAFDFVESFDEQQAAGVHDGDDVGDAFDFADLMAGEKHRATCGGDVDHAFEEFAADHGVEAGGRLVEDEELGLVGHGEREGDFARMPLESWLSLRSSGTRKPSTSVRKWCSKPSG